MAKGHYRTKYSIYTQIINMYFQNNRLNKINRLSMFMTHFMCNKEYAIYFMNSMKFQCLCEATRFSKT